ncbi:MAG TPA: dihydroorotate dehydrogenase-like protein [Bacteroidales bacterium]|nr:dihydroorotate dehydrogenase-like protein [Bacteroidales bacterium]
MAKLETSYLGLSLRSPLIVSSSGLNSSVDRIKKYQEFGAGAIVLKSLFEEQILHEVNLLEQFSDYTEATDYLKHYVSANNVQEYINLIKNAKQSVDIPVIASINCLSDSQWLSFASRIQEAGADALEVNIYYLPLDPKRKAEEYELVYNSIAEKLQKVVTIPVAYKLGSHFTNPLNVVESLRYRGAKGVVLFNRFFEPDIDIHAMKVVPANIFSNPSDLRYTLRWVAIASHLIPEIDISASTGVHDGEALVKMLLAGAKSVQVCSAIYRNGPKHIEVMLNTLAEWMNQQGFKTISDFRGKLNVGSIPDPTQYERSQFMKYFSNYE